MEHELFTKWISIVVVCDGCLNTAWPTCAIIKASTFAFFAGFIVFFSFSHMPQFPLKYFSELSNVLFEFKKVIFEQNWALKYPRKMDPLGLHHKNFPSIGTTK